MRDDWHHGADPFRAFLLSDESRRFRTDFAELQLAVDVGLATDQTPDPGGYREQAELVAEMLTKQAELIPDEEQVIPGHRERHQGAPVLEGRDPIADGFGSLGRGGLDRLPKVSMASPRPAVPKTYQSLMLERLEGPFPPHEPVPHGSTQGRAHGLRHHHSNHPLHARNTASRTAGEGARQGADGRERGTRGRLRRLHLGLGRRG
jgi:hypothetical protein